MKGNLKGKKLQEGPNDADTRRCQLLERAKKALHIGLYEETVKGAFAEAGVWPLNRQHILNYPAVGEVAK